MSVSGTIGKGGSCDCVTGSPYVDGCGNCRCLADGESPPWNPNACLNDTGLITLPVGVGARQAMAWQTLNRQNLISEICSDGTIRAQGTCPARPSAASTSTAGNIEILGFSIKPIYPLAIGAAALWMFSSMEK